MVPIILILLIILILVIIVLFMIFMVIIGIVHFRLYNEMIKIVDYLLEPTSLNFNDLLLIKERER